MNLQSIIKKVLREQTEGKHIMFVRRRMGELDSLLPRTIGRMDDMYMRKGKYKTNPPSDVNEYVNMVISDVIDSFYWSHVKNDIIKKQSEEWNEVSKYLYQYMIKKYEGPLKVLFRNNFEK
jgi:hypothetical protein